MADGAGSLVRQIQELLDQLPGSHGQKAEELGVGLSGIEGSGAGGRISVRDVARAAGGRQLVGEEASVEYVEPNLVKLGDSDFHLEEPRQDIRGFEVYDADDDKLGTVEDFYIDREACVTRFLDVKAGGFLGVGRKHFLIPAEEVTRNTGEEERVVVNHGREKVLDFPDFDPDAVPDLAFQRSVYAHYGRSAPEGSSTTKITREQLAAKKESGDAKEVGEARERGGDGVIATVAKKAGKGAAKGAVKGAAKGIWKG